jgi:hypothetical protein
MIEDDNEYNLMMAALAPDANGDYNDMALLGYPPYLKGLLDTLIDGIDDNLLLLADGKPLFDGLLAAYDGTYSYLTASSSTYAKNNIVEVIMANGAKRYFYTIYITVAGQQCASIMEIYKAA